MSGNMQDGRDPTDHPLFAVCSRVEAIDVGSIVVWLMTLMTTAAGALLWAGLNAATGYEIGVLAWLIGAGMAIVLTSSHARIAHTARAQACLIASILMIPCGRLIFMPLIYSSESVGLLSIASIRGIDLLWGFLVFTGAITIVYRRAALVVRSPTTSACVRHDLSTSAPPHTSAPVLDPTHPVPTRSRTRDQAAIWARRPRQENFKP